MALQTALKDYMEELEEVDTELAIVEVKLQDLLERQNALQKKKSKLKRLITENEAPQQPPDNSYDIYNGTDFPWTTQINEKLNSVFKLKELRPLQRQTMNVTMSGKDCILIMPTGGGKSLCFQLPAVISKGLTLVVSPLVSLMEDQLMALEQLSVASAVLNASSSKEQQNFVLNDMVQPNGSLRLLYVTPEKLAKSKRFMNKLEKCYSIGHLSRLVIDEVHCCSQWGHDFRPDYKFLGIMKRQFPNTPILGLTATATTKVLEDVKKILNIPQSVVLKACFNRPNLFYEIVEKPSAQKDSIDVIQSLIQKKFRNQSGIVYCFSKKESEEVATGLSLQGVKAGCYHGDMSAKARSDVHRRWLNGKLQVVVATIAFGMGIDKPDVRFVIHHTISKSMENFYQESGRAGRDGERSDCIVLYRFGDVIRQSTMVFTEQTGLDNLHAMMQYCVSLSGCRRSVIARHFGEVWEERLCSGMCDLCHRRRHGGNVEKRDITHHCVDVLTILDLAGQSNQRLTANKLVDAWYGKGGPGLKLKSLKPPSISKATAERVLARMLMCNYLFQDFHFTAYSTICYLTTGTRAHLIKDKSAKVTLDFAIPSSTSSSSSNQGSTGASSKPLKSSSAADKPKLVVVNMEKSHFNSTSVNSSSSSSSLSSSTTKACSLSKSKSLSSSSSSSKPSSSRSKTSLSSSLSSPTLSTSKLNNPKLSDTDKKSRLLPSLSKNLTNKSKLKDSHHVTKSSTDLQASDSDGELHFDDEDNFASQIRIKSSNSQKDECANNAKMSTLSEKKCAANLKESSKLKSFTEENNDSIDILSSDDEKDAPFLRNGKQSFVSDKLNGGGKRKRMIISDDDSDNDDIEQTPQKASRSRLLLQKLVEDKKNVDNKPIFISGDDDEIDFGYDEDFDDVM